MSRRPTQGLGSSSHRHKVRRPPAQGVSATVPNPPQVAAGARPPAWWFFWGTSRRGSVGDGIAPRGAIFPPQGGAVGPCCARTCEGCPGTSAAVLRRLSFPSRPRQGPERSGFLSRAPSQWKNKGFLELGLGVPGIRDASVSETWGRCLKKLLGSLRLWISGRREQSLVSQTPSPGGRRAAKKRTRPLPPRGNWETGVECPCCPAESWN